MGPRQAPNLRDAAGTWPRTEDAEVVAAAGTVSAGTLVSRVSGFVRDLVVAGVLGTGTMADAFVVAFRIPNLLRRLMGEGALTVSFIPVFTEYLSTRSRAEADRLGHVVFTISAITLGALTAAGIIFSGPLIRVMAPGFAAVPEKLALTVHLNQWMFPHILFVGLTALAMGLLNALGRFAAPAMAPSVMNVAVVASVLGLGYAAHLPVESLIVGVLVGGVLQFALQWPALRHAGFRFRLGLDWHHPGMRRILLLLGPSTFGLAVAQVSMLVNTLLASFLPEGSVAYLYYADRLVQFPLGLFAMAIATAVLPSLSRSAVHQDVPTLVRTLNFAIRLTVFTTVPAMAGLIILREPIVRVLFERGAFTTASSAGTAQAVLFYAVGLWAVAGVRIIVPAFYALQDTATPVKVAAVALAVNIGAALVLMGPLAHGGLALATSVGAAINFLVLGYLLRRRLGRIGARLIARSTVKICAASIAMGAVVWVIVAVPAWGRLGGPGGPVSLVVALGAAVGVFAALAHAMRMDEWTTLVGVVRSRRVIGDAGLVRDMGE